MKSSRLLSVLAVAVLSFVLPLSAGATVKKEGGWPEVDKKVDLQFDGKPSEGLKRLAKEAGWSLVVANGVAVDGSGGDVHVSVDDQPADAVLDALFVGRNVVAYRNGDLVTLTPGSTDTASVTPPAPAPAAPAVRGDDRNVFGGSLVIHKGEVAHNVTVAGGSLKVEGTITGDLVIAGGSAKILSGGRVMGNATVFGGSLKVEKDARVDGSVGIAGGALQREEGSFVGGGVVDSDHDGNVHVKVHDGEMTTEVSPKETGRSRSRFSQAAHSFGQSVTRMALLFVLGCVLLALLAPPMERLRVEIASRPMRSFALGLVGSLLGSIALAIVLVVLCVTVIGIPVALVGVLLAILAVYGGIASVLTTVGAAVIGHRTSNTYLHLLFGCGAFLVLSAIPAVGPIVTLVVTMVAVGALLVTRGGGLFDRRRRTGLV